MSNVIRDRRIFNSSGSIGGGGTSITVVANYAALPAANTVAGQFYWVTTSTGTHLTGVYYSNGTTWEFNPAENITVVANYSALPAVGTVTGEFYWASASQGTSWLPGGLGGTYYSAGLYYSNGVTWEFLSVPYNATQAEVNTGTNNDKFVTPSTLKNSTQWVTLNLNNTLTNGNTTSGKNIVLTTGDYLKSSTGNTQLDLTGSAFAATTDNGGYLTPYLSVSTGQVELAGLSGGGVVLSNTGLAIAHNTLTQFSNSPVRFTALTASTVPYLDSSKNLTSSAVTPTQLSYVDATSSIQTQMNGKQASGSYEVTTNKDATGGYAGLTLFKINFKNAANTFTSFFTNSNTAARTYTFKDADGTIAFTSDITGTNSGTNTGDETAARIGALINGSSAATPNDADLVATAESSVLKKITWTNVKTFLKTYFDTIYATLASPTFTGTVTTPAIIVSSETASRVAILDASKNIKSADTTTYPSLTELAYLKGVTSALQTQLAKMPKNYAFSAGYNATLSAGTDEVAFSILIPAGTAITNDSINLYQSHSVNSSANAKSVCVYFSTINETIGAVISGSGTKIATITGLTGAAVLSSALVRHFNARSNTSLINIYSVLSLGTDSGTLGAVTSAITIPTLASDIYLVGTVNRANAGDTVTINMCQLQIMKS